MESPAYLTWGCSSLPTWPENGVPSPPELRTGSITYLTCRWGLLPTWPEDWVPYIPDLRIGSPNYLTWEWDPLPTWTEDGVPTYLNWGCSSLPTWPKDGVPYLPDLGIGPLPTLFNIYCAATIPFQSMLYVHEWKGALMTQKQSVGITQEVNLRNQLDHGDNVGKEGIHPTCPGFETHTRHHQNSKTGVFVTPRKGLI